MTVASRFPSGRSLRRPLPTLLVVALLAASLAPLTSIEMARGVGGVDHLVISEVVTGGASASDELIELHNPTTAALPLEGLEVIYVTASGATISRRAAWQLGAPSVPAGGHVLIANASGIYASIADATYASGMAATGGSVGIRILGASTAIDAAGWGTAVGAWLEGTAAAAPMMGASIERRPGDALGSGQDTDDNLADFVERFVPKPQNLGSPPTPDPSAPIPSPDLSATPGPTGSPDPTSVPTPSPTATSAPTATPRPASTPSPSPVITIAEARTAPDGGTVTIEAVALTGSDFHDGGGFVADATGGIAVLLAGAAFASGELLRISGEIDDRFSQRTVRADAGSLVSLGAAGDPAPAVASTGAVGEELEGELVHIIGTILGSPTTLTSGVAVDVDDGSGATRVVVGTATGIDTAAWQSGTTVDLIGVAGQRDSTGSGSEGYRVMPRDADDVLGLTAPTGSPMPSPSSGERVTSIADARRAAKDTQLRIRGVVTFPTGLIDDGTAVVQDATGAILLRLFESAGRLRLGARVEVDGRRSTLSGMETLRVSHPVLSLGAAAEPAAREMRTGNVMEADEAMLVVTRGAIVASARRSSTGTVSFEIDDGSGPLRVSLAARLHADRGPLVAGSWVQVRGVVGQETSRSKPDEGYRIWPRAASEVRVTAPATGRSGSGGGSVGGSDGGDGGPTGSLDDLGATDLSQLRIGATLVVGRWRELGVGGLLWDGSRLVAVHASSGDRIARLTRERHPPLALDLGGLQAAGTERVIGVPVVMLGSAASQTVVLDAPTAPPRATLAGDLPAWVSVVGHLSGSGSRRALLVDGERAAIHERCEEDGDDDRGRARGAVAVTGVVLDDPLRLIVPCGGVRSAPSLATGAALMAPVGVGTPHLADVASADQRHPDLRRAIAAGLLLTAAVVLIGGAVTRRRRQPVDEEPGSADDAAGPGASEARLTLVRVPHEGGP